MIQRLCFKGRVKRCLKNQGKMVLKTSSRVTARKFKRRSCKDQHLQGVRLFKDLLHLKVVKLSKGLVHREEVRSLWAKGDDLIKKIN
jgi:hypothetical protein